MGKKNKGKQTNVEENVVVSPADLKHPLEYSWSLWVFLNEKTSWEDNLVRVAGFNTVEDFWCLYHHTKLPTELKTGQDYLIFKESIEPIWEHPANKKGGRWIINFDKSKISLDTLWLQLTLLMIGNNLVHNDIVCGAVVNSRTKSKISLWLSDGSSTKKLCAVGKELKKQLGRIIKLNFHLHTSSSNMLTL
ncbi:unnamed protein product [Leptosia nina]|uniref:EIF-4F 25 kDa subunit n=1 Tax=Leptosia nina TaxID=320188 RepID=A0AAV1JVN2_9NEOP